MIQGRLPVPYRHCPFFRYVPERQIQQLEGRFIVGERTPIFRNLATESVNLYVAGGVKIAQNHPLDYAKTLLFYLFFPTLMHRYPVVFQQKQKYFNTFSLNQEIEKRDAPAIPGEAGAG